MQTFPFHIARNIEHYFSGELFRKKNLSSSDIGHDSQCDEQPAEHLAALEVLQHGPQDPQLDPHDLAADQREGGQRHPAHRVQEPVLTAGRYRARFFYSNTFRRF